MASEPSQREPTPEERLFKIIQEGKADPLAEEGRGDLLRERPLVDKAAVSDPAPPPATHEKKARRAMNIFNDPLVLRSLQRKILTSQTANRLLLTCLVTFFLYFVCTQFIWKESLSDAFMQKTGAVAPAPVSPEMLSGMSLGEDLGSDLSDVKKRNLFQPWRPPEPAPEAAASQPALAAPSGVLDTAASQLKLSGIYMSDEPEALLESTDEKKTYAVARGTEIKGVKVKEVRPDGVVLTDGQNEKVIQ